MARRTNQLWIFPNAGTAQRGVVADVAVLQRTRVIRSYAVPGALRERMSLGAVLRVPARKRGKYLLGICVGLSEQEWEQSQLSVEEVVQPGPLLTQALAELGRRVAEYYACPPGRTFAAMIPASARRVRTKVQHTVRLTGVPPTRKPTAGQRRVLEALTAGAVERGALLATTGVTSATLRAMERAGVISIDESHSQMAAYVVESAGMTPGSAKSGMSSPEDDFVLNAGQSAALTAIGEDCGETARFRVNLLFGVPGSGKTEVYVRAIRDVVARGRQAILLVPEIVLATQIVDRLARRFANVAVLHSRLTEKSRLENLRRIASGAVDVVIGTRTAIFAPCARLGLIVVDEEQEPSYKSLAAPLFHARDVAIMRGQIEKVPVVLGSATPALETWVNAKSLPHYRLLTLCERAPGARMPDVRLIATAARGGARNMGRVVTPELLELLRGALADGQQAILLHNRRGFAVHLKCGRCGLLICCDRCGSHVVFHRTENMVKCHRCGLRAPAAKECLDDGCRGPLEPVGLGIQRLEEELQQVLPTARLLRLDRDTLKRREDYLTALERFERREADILLGTQIVAKGLDFPGVRLVGVIDADAALRLPDFRAAERVFQLMMQVVGRAGRKEGESWAVLQSDDVQSAAIQRAARMDYAGFAEIELESRRRYFQPPFARLVRIVCSDDRAGAAREAATQVCAALRNLAQGIHPELRIDDAGPCVIKQLRGMTRWQVMARGPRDGSLQRLLTAADSARALSPRVKRIVVDVDPVELL